MQEYRIKIIRKNDRKDYYILIVARLHTKFNYSNQGEVSATLAFLNSSTENFAIDAANFVAMVQNRQGIIISAP